MKNSTNNIFLLKLITCICKLLQSVFRTTKTTTFKLLDSDARGENFHGIPYVYHILVPTVPVRSLLHHVKILFCTVPMKSYYIYFRV